MTAQEAHTTDHIVPRTPREQSSHEVLRALAVLLSRLQPGDRSTFQAATDAAMELLPADHASLRVMGSDGLFEARARSGSGVSAAPAPFGKDQGVMGWVARTGLSARVMDVDSDPRFHNAQHGGFQVRSMVAVPVTTGGKFLGVLNASSPQINAFSEEDELALSIIAELVGQALRIDELETLAVTDAHTLAFNRRYLFPRLREEMSRCRRHNRTLSILSMDLDHFKRINDQYGHRAGDDVLRFFAQTVRHCVRNIDILVRRGGEEFVLIMPSTTTDEAVAVAERIRSTLASQQIHLSTGQDVHQSVSIGVVTWDREETAAELDHRADQAMYDAKRRGRNRVSVRPDGSRDSEPSDPDDEAPVPLAVSC